jgi:NADH-quinone oxidoreductase subunit J
MQDLVFILVGLVTAGSAVLTVTSRNLVHAALFLAATLAGIGGVFLVMHADFVALVQIVVYVGAIAVLFLFGLMLTRAPIGREALDSQNRGMALAVSGVLFALLTTLIVMAFHDAASQAPVSSGIAVIGEAIFSTWVFPFELASMLLLGALIGAIVLARRESGESGEEQYVARVELSDTPPGDEPPPQLVTREREELPTGGQS